MVKTERTAGNPKRLWVKSTFVGFRRSKHTQNSKQALIKIQHVNDVESAKYYQGKRIAYVYRTKNTNRNIVKHRETKFKVIWGRVGTTHGCNGTVIARFGHNLPPSAMGTQLRVFLYPNRDF